MKNVSGVAELAEGLQRRPAENPIDDWRLSTAYRAPPSSVFGFGSAGNLSSLFYLKRVRDKPPRTHERTSECPGARACVIWCLVICLLTDVRLCACLRQLQHSASIDGRLWVETGPNTYAFIDYTFQVFAGRSMQTVRWVPRRRQVLEFKCDLRNTR